MNLYEREMNQIFCIIIHDVTKSQDLQSMCTRKKECRISLTWFRQKKHLGLDLFADPTR